MSLVWVVLLLFVLQMPRPVGAVFALLLVVVAAALWFIPGGRTRGLAPFVSDWKRYRTRLAARKNRKNGYLVGRDLGVLVGYPAEEEAARLKRGGKWLPNASFIVVEGVGYFRGRQQVARTDEQIVKAAEALAPTLGYPAEHVSLERPDASSVLVTWRAGAGRDLLAESVPFHADASAVAGDPVLIGQTSTGEPFRLNIWDRQGLVLGASGSGKGSIVWSTMLGLAPQIQAGTVKVIGVDLKGGVELMTGRGLFDSVAITFEQAAAAIRSLAEEVDRRLEYMRSVGSRKHVPTVEQPALLLLVDEYASLVYTAPDTKSRNAVEADLKRILSTGRAARINVLALAQDPRSDSVLARALFTNVVALRFRTKDDAALALGAAVVDAGAECHKISQSMPGTGYVVDSDGSGEPIRFRAFWCDDALITSMAEKYGKAVDHVDA
ncbi:FtsK/SpoIIIE domain-containing protein [Leucobacter sp. 1207-22]|uniref:FtsK/SpoIIIE domain-containing protein n=1 Tax=Leucobacter sp. 1207-22 TaxID=2604456 RepID=UPI004062B647